MSPSEIAEFEGLNSFKAVYKQIKVVSDRIEAGELNLFEIDPKKAEEAKNRIDAKRDRDRKSYQNNIVKLRAVDNIDRYF